MAKINLRNLLLTGTALVAVSTFSAQSARATDLTGNSVWGSAAGTDDLSGIATGTAIDTKSFTLTIRNDQTAIDSGADLNTFNVGAITDNDGGGKINILGYEGNALTVQMSSISDQVDLNITGNSVVDHTGIAVTVSGAAALGDVTITNNDTGTTHDLTVAFNGTFAADSMAIGTPGGNAGADAKVSFGGATVNFGTGLELSESASKAIITFNSGSGQTVTGVITAAGDGDGEIVINNGSGVTFQSMVGDNTKALRAVTVTTGAVVFEDELYTEALTANDDVTFEASAELGAATIKGNKTLTFNTTGAGDDTTIGGTIDGLTLDGDGAIVVEGGSYVVSFTGNIGSTNSLASIEMKTGTGQFKGNIEADAITIDDGATMEVAGGSAQTIKGPINGSDDDEGALFINNDGVEATFTGDVGATKLLKTITVGVDIDSDARAKFEGATISATDFIIHGVDSKLTFAGTGDQEVDGDITGGVGGEGNVIINNTGDPDDNVAFSGNVTSLNSIKVEAGSASFAGDVEATNILLYGGMSLNGTNNQAVDGDIDGIDDTFNDFGGFLTVSNQDDTKTVTFSGDIGSVFTLDQIDVNGGDVVFQGTVTARTLRIYSPDSKVTTAVGKDITTNVIFDDSGAMYLNGDLKGDADIDSGSITGSIDFNGYNASVIVGDGVVVEGDIDNTSSGDPYMGILELAGDFTVNGNVGATSGLNYIEAGEDGATVEFKGTVNVNQLRIAGGGLVTLDEGLVGDLDFFRVGSNTGIVEVADGKQIDGDVNANGYNPSYGTLTFLGGGLASDGNVGVTGDAGSSDSSLSAINAGVDSKTVKFAGEVYADDINFTGKGTIVFASDVYGDVNFDAHDGTLQAGDLTIDGNITNATTVAGTLKVVGGDLDVLGDIGLAKALTKIDLVSGNLTAGSVNATTIALDVNQLTVTDGGLTLASGQALTLKFDDGALDDQDGLIGHVIAYNENVTFSTGSTVTISGLAAGDRILLIDDVDDGYVGTDDFKATLGGGSGVRYAYLEEDGDIYITAAAISTTTNEGKTWNVVSDAAGDDDDISDLNDAINGAATDEERNQIIQSAMPTLDGSAAGIQTSSDVSARVFDIVQTRQDIARAGDDAVTSMAAGRNGNGMTLWAQAYGQRGTQDTKDGIKGYTSNTVGGVIGLDTSNIIPNGTFGLMLNYGDTSADSKNANTTTTNVETYGAGLYAAKNLSNAYFINGQVSYAYNRIESDRHNVGAPGVTAHGESYNNQYAAKVSLGRDFAGPRGLIVTPTVTANYAYIDVVGYTETGAGGLNLNIEDSTYQSAKTGVDLNFGWNLKAASGASVRPSFHFGYAYDFIGDRIETTAAFSGGGGSFTTTGAEPDKSSITGGLGLTYASTANWDFSANYDYTYRSTYDAHSGALKATTRF